MVINRAGDLLVSLILIGINKKMNLNKAMIIGNLTRDPEVKNTPAGTSVASFCVATNYVWRDTSGQKQQKAEFHNIVVWRKLAEICGQYLRKGSKVYLEGRLQTRDWIGQDGVKKYRTEIIADNMIMLDRAGAVNQNSTSEAPPTPIEEVSGDGKIIMTAPDSENSDADVEEEIKVEKIPF